jgi:Tfp pilus assembly protein PilV
MRSLHLARFADDRGMGLLEVMVAILLLTVGIIALVSSFDAAQRLTLTAERRSALTHRAQRQIETLETISYEQLAMSAAPTHSAEESNPDHYVDYHTPLACKEATTNGGCFAWNASNTAEEAALVIAGGGSVAATPESWSTGNVSGKTYSFVTWASDKVCTGKEEACPAENDYKRITVVVTATLIGGQTMTPVRVSVLIPNPDVAGENPLKNPGTTCGNDEKCTSGISSGVAQSWYLHDSAARLSSTTEPTASHTTHPTVAPTKATSCNSSEHSGCPEPDLMSVNSASAEDLWDYSTDQDGSATITPAAGSTCPGELRSGTFCYGGRVVQRPTAECSGEPSISESEANFKSEMWVTPPFEAQTTLTGSGGLSIYSQTLGGVLGHVTLCVALYRIPNDIEDLWAESKTTPTRLGWTSYTPDASADWPSSLQEIAFTFEPTGARQLTEPNGTVIGATGNEAVKLAAGERIGLRIWPATTSEDAISVVYGSGGHLATVEGVQTEVAHYPAQLQLNTE